MTGNTVYRFEITNKLEPFAYLYSRKKNRHGVGKTKLFVEKVDMGWKKSHFGS